MALCTTAVNIYIYLPTTFFKWREQPRIETV